MGKRRRAPPIAPAVSTPSEDTRAPTVVVVVDDAANDTPSATPPAVLTAPGVLTSSTDSPYTLSAPLPGDAAPVLVDTNVADIVMASDRAADDVDVEAAAVVLPLRPDTVEEVDVLRVEVADMSPRPGSEVPTSFRFQGQDRVACGMAEVNVPVTVPVDDDADPDDAATEAAWHEAAHEVSAPWSPAGAHPWLHRWNTWRQNIVWTEAASELGIWLAGHYLPTPQMLALRGAWWWMHRRYEQRQEAREGAHHAPPPPPPPM